MTHLRPGDRVRVCFEATLTEGTEDNTFFVSLTGPDGLGLQTSQNAMISFIKIGPADD